MKNTISKSCENCNNLRRFNEEMTAQFWGGIKYFCTQHQLFVKKDGCCRKWKKQKPRKGYTDREIRRIIRKVDRKYRKDSKKKQSTQKAT